MGDVVDLPQPSDDEGQGDDEAVVSLHLGGRHYQLTLTAEEAEELLRRLKETH